VREDVAVVDEEVLLDRPGEGERGGERGEERGEEEVSVRDDDAQKEKGQGERTHSRRDTRCSSSRSSLRSVLLAYV